MLVRFFIPAFFAALLALAARPWAQIVWRVATAACMAYLGAVTLRRFALTAASLRRRPTAPPVEPAQDLLVVIAARNEAAVIDGTLAAASALDWPSERLRIAVIDDGSDDGTAGIIDAAAARDERVRVLYQTVARGKGAALNTALAQEPFGEWVYVLDADTRPAPDAPRRLFARAAADGVAAAQGAMTPRNPGGVAASHTALESAIHQHITHAGADRLGLTSGLLGANTLIRRSTLVELGGFAEDLRLEDIDLTARLRARGYRIAFEPTAGAGILASESATESARQHRAWFADYRRVAARHASAIVRSRLCVLEKADLALFLLSYVDRAALILYVACCAAAWIAGANYAPWWFVAAVASAPVLQVAVAWRRAGLDATVAAVLRTAAFLVVDTVVHAVTLFAPPPAHEPGRRTRRTVDDVG